MNNNTNSGAYTVTVTIASMEGDVVYTKRCALNPSKEWIEKLRSSQADK